MNVLVIALEFPPVNTTGNFRAARFVSNLPRFGINPVVLTLTEDAASKAFGRPIHNELLNAIPEGTAIHRYPIQAVAEKEGKLKSFLRIYFRITEGLGKKFWDSIQADLPAIIEKHDIKAVYVTCPPFGVGEVGYKISRQFKLPLIVDMRDAWAYWTTNPHNTYLHFLLKLRSERKWFTQASFVIAATPELGNVFKKAHPGVSPEKFITIFNGADKLHELGAIDWAPGQQQIRIGYVGNFYYSPKDRAMMFRKWHQKPVHKWLEYRPTKEDWLYRSPYFFFKTVNALKKNAPDLFSRIRIEFMGDKPSWLEEMVNEFDLADKVIFHGFVGKDKMKEIQSGLDALLTTSEKVVGDRHYCLPSKLFDYLKTSKPILAFVTPGDQEDFLRKAGTAILFNPDDAEKSAEKLVAVLNSKTRLEPDTNFLRQFDGQQLTGELARLLKQLS